MKKRLVPIGLFCFVIVLCFNNACFSEQKIGEEKANAQTAQELIVYSDKDSVDNHYFPTERIGDGDALELDDESKENPQSGKTCIKITYNARGEFGFAGIYWVNPKGNWGNQKGGYDLRFAKKLKFWARGEKGGEYIAVFKFGGLKGTYPDSDNHGIGPIKLTNEWQEISVDVSTRDMRYITAGFSFAITKAHNRNGCVFYIDNIKYE